MESANLKVNDTTFYGNNASIGTLIAACGSNNNVSLDFDAPLNISIYACENYTLNMIY